MKKNKTRDKILIYSTSFFAVSETFIYNQVKVLSEIGEIHLLAMRYLNPHNYNESEFKKFKISRVNDFANRVFEKLFNIKLFSIQSYISLYKLFRENNYKAIHVHYGTKALEILPIVKWFNVPLVVSFHGADASRMVESKRYVDKLPSLFNYASAITISSQHMADKLNLDQWKEKVKLIPYGVDSKYFSPNSKDKDDNTLKILHAGRIVGKKGVPDLIRVFQQLASKYDDIELHLAGDGEEISECIALVESFGLDEKVTFYGNVKHEKIKELLAEADIYVLNSRVDEDGDMEGTPNTILEAMCMAKPVVSTRHAGIPYVIDHNKNGMLADERDNDDLRESIELLIKKPDLREELGNEARKTILQSYTLKAMEQQIREIFRAF